MKKIQEETKRGRIEFEGKVTNTYRGGMFEVSFTNQQGNDMKIMTTISGRMRKSYIKITLGDDVRVEVSPYDMGKGRIIRRLN